MVSAGLSFSTSCLALHCFAAEMSATGSGLMDPPSAQRGFIMAKKFMGLLAGMAVIGGAPTLFAPAADGKQKTLAKEV
jgi:hypothetical protein